jgi:DNA-directed RNA polymerase specialized sigma subunit
LLYTRLYNIVQGIEERRLQLQLVFQRKNITDRELAQDLGITPEKLVSSIHKGRLARDALEKNSYGLVRTIVKLFIRRIIDDEPKAKQLLFDAGKKGLVIAIDRFDPEMNFRLATTAVWWIRQSITDYLAERLKMNPSTYRLYMKMFSFEKLYGRQYPGEKPAIEEIAKYLKCSVEKVKEIKHLTKRMIVVDPHAPLNKGKFGGKDTRKLVDIIGHPDESEGGGLTDPD